MIVDLYFIKFFWVRVCYIGLEGFEIGCREIRVLVKVVIIEMEKREVIWDGKEGGLIVFKYRGFGRRLEGGFVFDVSKWVDEVIIYWMD